MKRILATILLLALFSGCAGRPAEPVEAENNETPNLAESHDWSEPSAVDDSYTAAAAYEDGTGYYAVFEGQRLPLPENADRFVMDSLWGAIKYCLLPTYVARWVEDGEILETAMGGSSGTEKGCYFGWVCFTDTPKTELGWRMTEYGGVSCYCRGFFIRAEKDESEMYRVTADRSIPMEPVAIDYFISAVNGVSWFDEILLPALESAELYVPQLGRSFVMTDPDELVCLENALSKPLDQEQIRGVPADLGDQETLCPMYLYFSDGGSALMFTAGDGADACVSGGGPAAVFGGKSVFDRFGVPLAAAGYTYNSDGSTTVKLSTEGLDQTFTALLRYTRDVVTKYDPQGRLVSLEDVYLREDYECPTVFKKEYFYREDGRIDHYTEDYTSEFSDWYGTYTYVYNEKELLTRISYTSTTSDSAEAATVYRELEYDDQDRLVAWVYHYGDGREGLPTGNIYFWYDESGQRQSYYIDFNGNAVGGPGGDAGDNPVRR